MGSEENLRWFLVIYLLLYELLYEDNIHVKFQFIFFNILFFIKVTNFN